MKIERGVLILLIMLFVAFHYLFSQKISDSLLFEFSNQTLISFFEDSPIINEQGVSRTILVEADVDKNCLIKEIQGKKIEYFPLNTNLDYKKYVRKLRKKSMLYVLKYRIISSDTVDIIISSFQLYKDNKKGYKIALSCGGTMGYIPQGRFIYNKETGDWDFIRGRIILEKKAEELNKYLEEIFEENKRR